VDEALRIDPPVQLSFRRARTDVELGGELIAADTEVLIPIGLVQRDPEVFDEPDEFRLDRPKGDNLGFGFGIHYCLGAALARAEARVSTATTSSASTPTRLRNGIRPCTACGR
jgi:cytochrome P450